MTLYGIVGVLMTIPWAPMWWRLAKRPEMFRPGFDAAFARHEGWRAWPGIVVYAVCTAIGFVQPVVALVLFLLVAIFYGVSNQGWTAMGDVGGGE